MKIPTLLVAVATFTSYGLLSNASAEIIDLSLNAEPSQVFTTGCGNYTYFKVNMPNACQDLNITAFPTDGKVDIYVKKNDLDGDDYPTKNKLTWSSAEDPIVSISHWDLESSPGEYFIGVYGDCRPNTTVSYKIEAVESNVSSFDATDIYDFPNLSFNKLIEAGGYEYYHFCVPQCADVKVTLENCLDSSICPESYSYPELVVSRTELEPTINSYT